MQHIRLQQGRASRRHTAGFMQVLHYITAAGFHIRDRGTLAPPSQNHQRQFHFDRMGDRQEMENRIVEPPSAITTVIVFSNACFVMICRGKMPLRTAPRPSSRILTITSLRL